MEWNCGSLCDLLIVDEIASIGAIAAVTVSKCLFAKIEKGKKCFGELKQEMHVGFGNFKTGDFGGSSGEGMEPGRGAGGETQKGDNGRMGRFQGW